MSRFFEITAQDKKTAARTGVLHTAHGDVQTPVFMPVGTQGAVKMVDSRDLEELGAEIILGNTYHLHLRPHEEIVAKLGGLHRFMNYPNALLTDSGGFQVFSLGAQHDHAVDESLKTEHGALVEIDDDGVTFRSHLDGSTHRFTPEESIRIQKKLGADIVMAFDECTPDSAPREYIKKAMDRTHAWARRSLNAMRAIPQAHDYPQFLFGIIQGGPRLDLRNISARAICAMDFDGIAIGGESIGFNMPLTQKILSTIMPLIPENKPRYTMGVGVSPADIFAVVERGVDMFDCVAPTRMARNGTVYSRSAGAKKKFRFAITNAQFCDDRAPIEKGCACFACKNFSRAYLHHLLDAKEALGPRLATIHNLHFLLSLLRDIRSAIAAGTFIHLKKIWLR